MRVEWVARALKELLIMTWSFEKMHSKMSPMGLSLGDDIRGVAVAGVEGEPVTLTEPVTEAIAAAFVGLAILPLLSGQRRGIPKSLTHGCLHAPGWGQGEFSDKPRRLILLSQPCSQYLAYSAKTLATQKLKKLGRQLLKEWKLFITQRSFYKCLEAHLLGALAK
ncbi:hypothetical protein CK203_080583 [Vitis vinifera]|uniref:Uncharacterized protein n=1 Tax=Vitis vinifera TaxID=29760 RepID=A0A438D9G9_VITVI|nr:hypothetical protein CK203_080583 [Vitis vinifera]